MNHIWSILCQKSSIDSENNLLSLFECMEELNVVIDKTKLTPEDNFVIPIEFQMVSFWTVENDRKLQTKIEMIDPEGKILNQFENKFEIQPGALRFRNRANIQGLPLTTEGRYTFKVWKKNEDNDEYKPVAAIPLDIKISYRLTDPSKK